MAQTHPILGNLDQKYHSRFGCDDIEMIKAFIAEGIDLRIFDAYGRVPPQILELLMDNGYPVDSDCFRQILKETSNVDSFIEIIKIVMDRLDFSEDVFKWVMRSDLMQRASDEIKSQIFEFVSENYPNSKIDAKRFRSAIKFSHILERHINFEPRELIYAYIEYHGEESEEDILKSFVYCDEKDYVQRSVFRTAFRNGHTQILKLLLDLGYNFTSEDWPLFLATKIIESYEFIKSYGIWAGDDVFWNKNTGFDGRINIYSTNREYCCKWLAENGFPAELHEEKIKWI
jgi:hypothetical protein